MTDARISIEVDSRPSEAGARRVRRSLDGVKESAFSLQNAFRALFTGLVAREFIQAADTMQLLGARLSLVTRNTQELAAVQRELFNTAQRTRQSFEATATLYTRVARNADQLGASARQILQFTETIQQLVVVSGASAQEAQAAIIQLSQGLASGELRGEELRSVMEQLPAVAKAAADAMGLTLGQFREQAFEGQITATRFFDAILAKSAEAQRQFEQIPTTISQAFQQLQNEMLVTIGAMDRAGGLTEEFVGAIDELRDVIGSAEFQRGVEAVAEMVRVLATETASAIQQVGRLAEAFDKLASGILPDENTVSRFLDNTSIGRIYSGLIGGRFSEQLGFTTRAENPGGRSSERRTMLSDLTISGEGVGGGAPRSATKGYEDELRELQEQREAVRQLVDAYREGPEAVAAAERAIERLNEIQKLNKKFTDEEKASLTGLIDEIREAQREIENLTAISDLRDELAVAQTELRVVNETAQVRRVAIELAEKEIDLRRRGIDLTSEQAETELELTKQVAATRGEIEEAQRQRDLFLEPFRNAIQGIQSEFTDMFEDIFSGGVDSFEDLSESIKRIFIRLAAEIATLMVFRPVVSNVLGSVGLGGVAQQMGMGGGGFSIPGINGMIGGGVGPSAGGGLFSSIGNMFSAPGGFGGIGDFFGGLFGGGSGGFTQLATGRVAREGLASAATGAGGLGGGLSGAMAAIPVWGWIAGAATLAKSFVEGSPRNSPEGALSTLLGPSLEEWQNDFGRSWATTVDPVGVVLGDLGLPSWMTAGGLLADVFGKKPSEGETFEARFEPTGAIRNVGVDNGASLAAARQMADQFSAVMMSALDLTGGQFSQSWRVSRSQRSGLRLDTGGGWQQFANEPDLIQQLLGASGGDAGLRNALRRSQATDLQGFATDIQALTAIQDLVANDNMTELERAIKQVNDQFGELIDKSRELGYGTSDLVRIRNEEIAGLKEADRLSKELQREQIRAGVLSGVAGASSQINTFLDNQAFSPDSSLSPLQRLALAQERFGESLSAVQGGDVGQVGALTQNAGALLDIGRDLYASSAQFAALESMVRSSLSNVNMQITAPDFIESQVQIAEDQLNVQVSMLDQLTQMREEIADLSRQLRQQAAQRAA